MKPSAKKKPSARSERPSLNPARAPRWSMAAATGLLLAGCPDETSRQGKDGSGKDGAAQAAPNGESGADKECCMGKNECKGKGGCAVPESNSCAGQNDCKGKGGCSMHCPK